MFNIGNAFGAALQRKLEDKTKKFTIGIAAKQLGVSRQTIHSYLNGKIPRQRRLNKAMRMWDLNLNKDGHTFGKEAFGPEREEKAKSLPYQQTFWEMIDSLKEENLQVNLKRSGKTIKVNVTIEIPA